MCSSGEWTRSDGSRTVTVDMRGIDAGTPEGRAALNAATSLQRESDALGRCASPERAKAFNTAAERVAKEVARVAEMHRAQAAEHAAKDAFVREWLASR